MNKEIELLVSEEDFKRLLERGTISRMEQSKTSGDNFSSMNRVVRWITECECAMLSAWRRDEGITRKMNDESDRALACALRQYGYGLIRTDGRWLEAGNGMGRENSFLVFNVRNNDSKFFSRIKELSTMFNQDCFLYKKAADPVAYFYKTNDIPSEFFGDRDVVPAGKLHIGTFESDAYTRVGGGRIAFE